jgi:hypothetical protein
MKAMDSFLNLIPSLFFPVIDSRSQRSKEKRCSEEINRQNLIEESSLFLKRQESVTEECVYLSLGKKKTGSPVNNSHGGIDRRYIVSSIE